MHVAQGLRPVAKDRLRRVARHGADDLDCRAEFTASTHRGRET